MKSTYLLVTMFLAITGFPGAVPAQEPDSGLFVRPVIAYAQFGDSTMTGDIAGAVGTRTKTEDVVGGIAGLYRISKGQWSYELEYALRMRTDANGYVTWDDHGQRIRNNIQNQSMTLNVIRNMQLFSRFDAYVIAGAGVAHHLSAGDYSDSGGRFKPEDLDSYHASLTWTLGAGIRFVKRGWQYDVGYRFVDLGETAPLLFSNGLGFNAGQLTSHDLVLTISPAW